MPSEDDVKCSLFCGNIAPLMSSNNLACDWGNRGGAYSDPALSTSGFKGAGWAIVYIDRSKSRYESE